MHPVHPTASVCEIERAVLRALCQPSTTDALRESILRELAAHPWQAEDHRIVFNALRKIRNTNSCSLGEQLPAHATRMGFPDIDWAVFLDAGEANLDVEKLAAHLKSVVRQ
jgi:hypothetical protein